MSATMWNTDSASMHISKQQKQFWVNFLTHYKLSFHGTALKPYRKRWLTLHCNLCTCCHLCHFVFSFTHICPSISSLAVLNVHSFAQLMSILGPCDGWSRLTAGLTSQLKTITLIDGFVLRCFSDCWWHWKPLKTNITRRTARTSKFTPPNKKIYNNNNNN